MNRILKRPMFRLGGSAEGITSGLDAPNINASRQGYEPGGTVLEYDEEKGYSIDDLKNAGLVRTGGKEDETVNDTIVEEAISSAGPNESWEDIQERIYTKRQQARKEAGLDSEGIKPGQPGSISSMLTNFSLNLAAQPGGNLMGAVGKAGGPAFNKFQQAKLADKLRAREEKIDLFDESSDTATDIFEAQEETRRDIATQKLKSRQVYAKQQAADQLKVIYEGEISGLEDKLSQATNPEEKKTIKKQIQDKRDELQDKIISVLTDSQTRSESVQEIIMALIKSGDLDPEVVLKYYPELEELMPREENATGGRVGYQIGGDVMEEEVSETMVTGPEQTQDLTYEELRSRLPREIGNDIVQLLSASKQALMDFANIQTQQDVDNFNQQYDVDLVLPQEG